MKQSEKAITDFSGYRAIGRLCFVLAIFSLLVFAFLIGSYQGLTAALLAFSVCLIAVFTNRIFSLLVFRNRLAPTYYTLIGMLLRMGLPLGLCMALALTQSPLLDQGFAYYLIASYLIVLAVDVSMTLFKLKMEPAA
ncbi:MAG: hypothetical protein CBB70_05230 [Planctomycetaceae bacterium TMED10]|nr:MAG: hypothetical protein CBB70_05230 [Planctomycetaceae bacterium TMED10]